MIDVVTWNIQAGKGVDGVIDLERIARVSRQWGEPDVACFQEVACFVPEIGETDQVAILARLFPGYLPVFGAALDRAGATPTAPRCRFGNLILSRLPVAEIFNHPLPQPADPAVKHMARQITEAVVQAPSGPLRVLTTHFEFHAEGQRLAQAARLLDLQREAVDNNVRPAKSPPDGLYARPTRPSRVLVCGDFNAVPGDPVYRRIVQARAAGRPALLDAWGVAHEGMPHDPTCGIYDRDQWPQGRHCRDFFFIAPDLAPLVRAVDVDTRTDASDHQPVRLRLEA